MERTQTIRRSLLAVLVAVASAGIADDGWAQDPIGQLVSNDRGPRFLMATAREMVALDVSRTPVLRRRVSIDMRQASLRTALEAIARQAGLNLSFSPDVVNLEALVTLEAKNLTVAAALTEVLIGMRLDVVLSPSGQLSLVRQPRPSAVGVVTGRVTDASTQQGVPGVRVSLEGTRWGTTTGSTGSYRLAGVAAGAYTLVTRRLGYRGAERAVVVEDDREVTLDLTLEPVPSALNEVVVTATGEQRRVELGHVVGRINADSVVKAAPVSSISELLNGRVPGLQVNTYQGTVGGDVSIQLRSPNSIQLSTQPIIIVDGVRYNSRAADRITLGTANYAEPTSPLNDLNPNEIESIEVVKGPSAATLYGTDASNGVIVVTTKRGRPGPARWSGYMKGGKTTIPEMSFANSYWGWQTSGGTTSSVSCGIRLLASGSCTQDSVTVIPNPLNDPSLTIFASKPRWQYGVNVAGGSRALRYYFAADVEKALGPLQMPRIYVDSIAQVRPVLDEQVEPNAFGKLNLRTNVAALWRGADLQAQVGYSQRSTRTFGADFANPYASALTHARPGSPFGPGEGPDQYFSRTSTEDVNRLFVSGTARYSPASWLQLRAIAGADRSAITRFGIARRGEAPDALSGFFSQGEVSDDRGRQLATTAELSAAAAFNVGRISSRTSIGSQYVRTVDDILGTAGTDLPPGAGTIGAAASVQTVQNYREQVTLGSYVEQTFGLRQRLFLTGALRADGASTFGRNYDIVTYPKASVSWLVSEEPLLAGIPHLDDLRLRYAFGAAGQQPRPEWARPGYELRQVYHNGAITNVYTVTGLGNPELRPEVVREHEYGLDAGAFNRRLELGVTWFRRRTKDQIVGVTLPPGLGTLQTNLGLTTGRGFEAQLAVVPVDSRLLRWTVEIQHAFHRTMLEDLGEAPAAKTHYGGWVEGYPLGARFNRPLVGFEDIDGDGVIDAATELQFGDSMIFAGESVPPRTQTLVTVLSLIDGKVRVSGLFERRSGFTQRNSLKQDQCANGLCRAAVDPTTPLAEQAVPAALMSRSDFAIIEGADFTRLREVTVTGEVPALLLRALRLGSASISLQGRNLALWTDYSGNDPESAVISGSGTSYSRQELGIPQGRTWSLRFDFGF